MLNYFKMVFSVVFKFNDMIIIVVYIVVIENMIKCDFVMEFWEYVLFFYFFICLNLGCWGFGFRKYY